MALVRNQTNGLAKKITALATAGMILVGSTVVGVAHKVKQKDIDTTSISDDIDYTEDFLDIDDVSDVTDDVIDNTNELDELVENLNLVTVLEENDLSDDIDILHELKLLDDFDINDEEAVKQRAQDLYKLSEKEISIDMITNLIYLVNEEYASIKFDDDVTKFKYLQNMFVSLAELLDDNMVECRNAQLGDEYASPKYDDVIYPYMLMSKVQENPNSVFVSKQDAIVFAMIVRKQLNNIKDGNSNNYEDCANDYYNFYKKIEEKNGKDENATSMPGYTYDFYRGYTSCNTIMTAYLETKKQEELDGNIAEKYNESLAGKVIEACDIDRQEELNEALKDGNCGESLPSIGESYNQKDAAIANKRPEAGGTSSGKKVVEEGGKSIGSSSEKIKTPSTTTVVTETYVAEPITDSTTKNHTTKPSTSEATTKSDTTGNTTTAKQTTTAPSTTKPTTEPTGSYSEVVEEGGKVVFEGSLEDIEAFLKGTARSGNYVDEDEVPTTVKTK